eukprot:5380686-Prymnesium_polylepis.1
MPLYSCTRQTRTDGRSKGIRGAACCVPFRMREHRMDFLRMGPTNPHAGLEAKLSGCSHDAINWAGNTHK